jgi:hypothetical protein
MDGREYLNHVPDNLWPAEHNPTTKTAADILLPDFDDDLFGMILNMYRRTNECNYLDENAQRLAERVVDDAREQRQYSALVKPSNPLVRAVHRGVEGELVKLHANKLARSVERQVAYLDLAPNVMFGDLSPELQNSIVSIADMEYIGGNFSAQLLATTITRLARRQQALDDGKTTIAKEVREVLCAERKNFTRTFCEQGAVIAVTNGRVIRTDTVELRAAPETRTAQIEPWSAKFPTHNDWVNGYKKWDDALHPLCSKYSEFDTFVSLWLWCIKRNLPAVPVMAPRVVDLNMYPTRSGRKLNSDVLLCSLESGKIVPVQNKLTIDWVAKDKYAEGVVVAAPKHMKLVKVSSGFVGISVEGGARTGQESTTYYGANVVDFMRAHNPFKQQGKHSTPQADETFEFFDQHVLPELVA